MVIETVNGKTVLQHVCLSASMVSCLIDFRQYICWTRPI